MEQKIALITVTYNSSHLANRFAETANQFEDVIIIDNNSTDFSAEIFQKAIPAARVIKNSQNLGFGVANNVGLKIASSLGCTHSLIINPDCFTEIESVKLMISCMKKNNEIGLINPLISDSDNNPIDIFSFDFKIPYKLKSKHINRKPIANEDVILNFCIDGSCMLVKQEVFEAIGFFSEDLFLYCEEDDISLRLAKAGYTTALCIGAKATHLKAQSTSQQNSFSALKKSYHVRWSRFWMSNRYISPRHRLIEVIKIFAFAPFAIIFYIISGSKARLLKWIGWLIAAIDGLFMTKFFRDGVQNSVARGQ